MIAANELRIGNWLLLLQPEDEIPDTNYQIDATDIGVCDSNGDRFGPILLTPEILEKAGFEVREWEYGNLKMVEVFLGTDYIFNFSKDDIKTFGFVCKGEELDARVKSLHQLQNLYYALTGTELNITL